LAAVAVPPDPVVVETLAAVAVPQDLAVVETLAAVAVPQDLAVVETLAAVAVPPADPVVVETLAADALPADPVVVVPVVVAVLVPLLRWTRLNRSATVKATAPVTVPVKPYAIKNLKRMVPVVLVPAVPALVAVPQRVVALDWAGVPAPVDRVVA
jgi:hypothetical protein